MLYAGLLLGAVLAICFGGMDEARAVESLRHAYRIAKRAKESGMIRFEVAGTNL